MQSNLIGKRFGLWVVQAAASIKGKAKWSCLCDCGTRRVVTGWSLKCGDSTSCGCLHRSGSIVSGDYTGRKFSHLLSLGRSARVDRHNSRVFESVQCDCGALKEVNVYDLLNGKIKSCGCFTNEIIAKAKTRHGYSKGTRTYKAWAGALSRCRNPRHRSWPRYGGRGITVCERWHKFDHFLADMGECPGLDYEIDRIDNDGHYEPGNCRWVTARENSNNTSRSHRVSAFGSTKTIAQWEVETGIKNATIRGRISRGWTPERAVSTAVEPLDVIAAIVRSVDVSSAADMRIAIEKIRQMTGDTPMGDWARAEVERARASA